jgi:hypothetical protein
MKIAVFIVTNTLNVNRINYFETLSTNTYNYTYFMFKFNKDIQ